MNALYDLGRKPWTWDISTWLVIARARGATAVDFRLRNAVSSKWSMEESLQRLWNFMIPAVTELAQMTVTVDGDGVDIGASHDMRDVPTEFERLRLLDPWPNRNLRYTVTLRNTFHRPERNSDPSVWLKFARRIGAHVIDDSRHVPISLYDRFSLYAAAKMNYGIPNGPVTALFYTPYPVCMFSDPNSPRAVKGWADHGINTGDRMPWLRDDQHLIWAKPTLDVLLRQHEAIMTIRGPSLG